VLILMLTFAVIAGVASGQHPCEVVKINFEQEASPTPAGYIKDYGLAFSARNGFEYGFDIEGTIVPDIEEDNYSDEYTLRNLEVTDGRLTIAPAEGAFNGKLCFVETYVADTRFNPPPVVDAGPAQAVRSDMTIPAFPGAEGFGAYARGGRGGRVIQVTNLKDAGPGSFREAVEAEGPRIVVFRVSGNIELKSGVFIQNPFITIAGQTAPGDGICLKNYLGIRTHDVVLRYIRIRPGDVSGGAIDALGGIGCTNIIVDHCSASWSVDECVSFYRDNKNTTIQWCMIAESLAHSVHPKGRHGYGGIWGGTNASFHHNLLAHHTSRTPRFDGAESDTVDHRNNVIYNWGFNSSYGNEAGRVNMIANYYKSGPATLKKVRGRIVEAYKENDSWAGRFYIARNHVERFPEVTTDNRKGVHGKAPLDEIMLKKPIPAAPVTPQSADKAYELVLAGVGANFPKRDALDTRIVEETRTGTAKYGKIWNGGGTGIIDSQKDVGGWPELKSAPAPADSDRDGMPDAWEKKRGLDPNDASDGAKDRDKDGYTNVEEYINGLVATRK